MLDDRYMCLLPTVNRVIRIICEANFYKALEGKLISQLHMCQFKTSLLALLYS